MENMTKKQVQKQAFGWGFVLGFQWMKPNLSYSCKPTKKDIDIAYENWLKTFVLH